MRKNTYVVGVDIGGTNTTFGFVDKDGAVVWNDHFPTTAKEPPEKLVDQLVLAIKRGQNEMGDGVVLQGIGIGAPNANYFSGQIENPPNFDWEVVPLCEMVRAQLDLPVVMTNDANAAALGEMAFGKAKGVSDFIVITLGTGLGSGIVTGGQLLLGHDGFAGEMGHMVASVDSERRCGCGKTGCLETFASATGIVRTARILIEEGRFESPLCHLADGALTALAIGQAAKNGDLLALEAFEVTGQMLGVALANGVSVLSPRAIYLFGGLANAGELILEPTKRVMEQHLLGIFRNKVSLEISGLQQKNAAILGAAALIRHHLKDA